MLKLKSIKKSMEFAVENVIRYGDTDIFPYPLERQIFRDNKAETVELLENIYKNFDALSTQMPIEHEKLLKQISTVVLLLSFRRGH